MGISPDVGAPSIRWLAAMMQRHRRLALGASIGGSGRRALDVDQRNDL